MAAGDFHGDFCWLPAVVARLAPDLLLSPGDWGDPGEAPLAAYEAVIEQVPVLTVAGNHDDRALLARLRNRDGSPVLPRPRPPDETGGLGLVLIGSLAVRWHAHPHHGGKRVRAQLPPCPSARTPEPA